MARRRRRRRSNPLSPNMKLAIGAGIGLVVVGAVALAVGGGSAAALTSKPGSNVEQNVAYAMQITGGTDAASVQAALEAVGWTFPPPGNQANQPSGAVLASTDPSHQWDVTAVWGKPSGVAPDLSGGMAIVGIQRIG
jgi:hypothetical protein